MITKSQLKRIIKEEMAAALNEANWELQSRHPSKTAASSMLGDIYKAIAGSASYRDTGYMGANDKPCRVILKYRVAIHIVIVVISMIYAIAWAVQKKTEKRVILH